jgi:proteasome lid subunit RPN8/RPN11
MIPPFRLTLPAQFVEEMVAHARADLPNECCGLLAGTLQAGVGRVERRYPLTNAAASPVEYLSDARDMFAAMRDMRQRGIEELAVYHSHPTSDPIPSKTDRDRNYSPEVVNLIISLKNSTPSLRAWWLTADSATEGEYELV